MSGKDRGGDRGGKRFLRMDSKYPPVKISDPSLVVGKRKEIVNVMRKARDNPNDYWDKKLLEVEERDPGRWRHSGFKKLYVEGESPKRSSSRSRSPPPRPRSPPPNSRARKPMPPPAKRRMSVSPPVKRHRPPSPGYRPQSSSSSSKSRSRSRSPPPQAYMKSSRYPEAGNSKSIQPPVRYRTPSPIYRKAPEKRYAEKVAPPEKPPRSHKVQQIPRSSKHISPKPRVTSTSDEYNAKTKARPQEPAPVPSKVKKSKRIKEKHVPIQRIKIEDEPRQKRRSRSSSSSSSSSSSNSGAIFSALNASTRMTLSERFGKIAQWSTDRTNMENMRITKNSAGGDLKVLIEEETSTNSREAYLRNGNFPNELHTTAPVSSGWDDINVRYRYYKGAGYLKGLTLEDYIRWEEWWFQYKEWLHRCQLWEANRMNRRPRRKLPISARLN